MRLTAATPARPQADAVVTCARLLDAALQCYQHRGVAPTTLADIAARAGVTRTTVYRYFDNRDVLLKAVLRRELQRYWAALRAAFEAQGMALGDYLAEMMACFLYEARGQQNPALIFLPGVQTVLREILESDREYLQSFAEWLRSRQAAEPDTAVPPLGDWLVVCEWFNRLLASYLANPSLLANSEAELAEWFRRVLHPPRR